MPFFSMAEKFISVSVLVVFLCESCQIRLFFFVSGQFESVLKKS